MRVERKICKRCGDFFTSKNDNTMCKYCISMVLDDEAAIRAALIPPPKKTKKSKVEIDANNASKAGMSYGYYMAWKEGRYEKH